MLLARGGPAEGGFVRFMYRPFDNRWLYWEADSGLLDRPRRDYRPSVFDGNMWLEARQRESREGYSRGTLLRHLGDNFGNGLSSFFPAWVRDDGLLGNAPVKRANLSVKASVYLSATGATDDDLFHFVLATLHDPEYRQQNYSLQRIRDGNSLVF